MLALHSFNQIDFFSSANLLQVQLCGCYYLLQEIVICDLRRNGFAISSSSSTVVSFTLDPLPSYVHHQVLLGSL